MKKICGVLAVILSLAVITYLVNRRPLVTVDTSEQFSDCADTFQDNLVNRMNSDEAIISVAGTEIIEYGYDFYVSDEMKVMVESDFLKSLICCSILPYKDGTILVMKGENKIEFTLGESWATVNDFVEVNLGSAVYQDEVSGKVFVPFNDIAEYLGYTVQVDVANAWVDFARDADEMETRLPVAYDMRDYGRVTNVRDQGRYGTCWAFASLGALETTLMPNDINLFSTDHMTLCNSYDLGMYRGGEHTMSIAYLAAWQGPVYEQDDPYGDGETDSSLKAVKHLQEALVINDRDFETIKSAIFRYGAIETSLYLQMAYVDSVSQYYSDSKYSYYYYGEEAPNHDVVVVGWDDNYPKENFTNEPEGDGAFICKNSWGEEFGDKGYFYVSYYDANICNKSVVYTKVGNVDNYDKIYQTDLLGWVGLMGFNEENAYFANVYKAGVGEELSAVSFYATDKNTEFEVYVVPKFLGKQSLKDREFVVAGSMKYAGYYTVDLPEPIKIEDNQQFAVVVKIKTEGADYPIAIEYNQDSRTENFDITDGKGYISLYGEVWHSAEDTQACNVCLKAFTRKASSDGDSSSDGNASNNGTGNVEYDITTTESTEGTNEGQDTSEPSIDTEAETEE